MGDYERGEKEGKKLAEYEKKHPFVAPLTSDFVAAVERGCQSEEFKQGYDSGRGVSFGDTRPNESSSGGDGGGAGEGSAYGGGDSYSSGGGGTISASHSSAGLVGCLVVLLGVIIVAIPVSIPAPQPIEGVKQEAGLKQKRWEQFVSNSDKWLEAPESPLPLPGKIIFISSEKGNKEIFLADPNSSKKPVNLTERLTGSVVSVAPSLDGKKIAFAVVQEKENGWQIYVMNSDGTNLTLLGDSDDALSAGEFGRHGLGWPGFFRPDGLGGNVEVGVGPQTWPPSGDKIVFYAATYNADADIDMRHTNCDRDHNWCIGISALRKPWSSCDIFPQVYWLDISGKNPAWSPHRDNSGIDLGNGAKNSCAWSPDGKQVSLTVYGKNPAWSPDGNWIAFDNQGTIYALEVASGNVRKIVGPTFSGQSGEKPLWVYASW